MTFVFAVLAWATLLAVFLNACMDLADRWHWWRRKATVVDVRNGK